MSDVIWCLRLVDGADNTASVCAPIRRRRQHAASCELQAIVRTSLEGCRNIVTVNVIRYNYHTMNKLAHTHARTHVAASIVIIFMGHFIIWHHVWHDTNYSTMRM